MRSGGGTTFGGMIGAGLLVCGLLCGTVVTVCAAEDEHPTGNRLPPLLEAIPELPITPRQVHAVPPRELENDSRRWARARMRLTADARKESGAPFDPLADLVEHIEWFSTEQRPMLLSGYVRALAPARMSGDEGGADQQPLYQGLLSVPGSRVPAVHFLVGSLPEGMPTGDDLRLPVTLCGYVIEIPAADDAPPVPLLVAWEPHWQRTAMPAARLQEVKDNSLGVRDAETDAYFDLLQHARLIDYGTQRTQARENARQRIAELTPAQRRRLVDRQGELKTYVDLFQHPDLYRGRLVTLTGHARKAIAYAAGPNAYGIEQLYEVWLFTDDSQSNPAVLICTSLPKDLPLGDNISASVSVTGYFFKQYVYPSQKAKFRIAPLLLAQRVNYRPTADEPWRAPWYAAAIVVPLLLAAAVALWWMNRRDRAARRRLAALAAEPESPPEPGT